MGSATQKSGTDSSQNEIMPVSTEKAKILVVDDRPENLIATRKILKSIDAEVLEAESGNAALSLMLRHRFAVVLLDVQMPEMDGFEVARLMNEHEEMKNTPVVFVTAISKEEHFADRAAEIGAVDYIYKPINSNILKSKVQVYVDLFSQQKQLRKLNDILKKNNEELERFAYICSHDLQEPARMMGSFAEFLHEDYKDLLDDKGQKYLDFIYQGASQMQKMINDILTFSRVGHEAVELKNVDSQEIVQNIVSKLDKDIKDINANIVIGRLPVLQTSETLVSVLMQNLISNALKYQDGREPLEIEIQAEESQEAWLFSVKDNGIGIKPEYEHKVFAMFQRIHRKEDYPGTGIGLSTCKKYIELYGGKIWFESTPDQGSIFLFTIPKKQG